MARRRTTDDAAPSDRRSPPREPAQAAFAFPREGLGEPELTARRAGLLRVAGIDEAGRGPLVGSVVAACVVLPPDHGLVGLNDSKQLDAAERERLFVGIRERALAFAVAESSAARIDEINILAATKEAMVRALAEVRRAIDVQLVLVDGNQPIATELPQRTLVGGDARSENIAAASILAKVTRDAQMVELHGRFPQYGFDKHKGYPTPEHYAALAAHGPTPVHRRTFRGVVPR